MVNIPFPRILSWKFFISSSRFLCNARISSMELLLRSYGPKKTDMDPIDGKLHHQKAAKKWRSTWSLRYFWCGHIPKENSTHPKENKIKRAEQSCHHWNHESWRGLGCWKNNTPSWCFGMTHNDNDWRRCLRDSWIWAANSKLAGFKEGTDWKKDGSNPVWPFLFCFFVFVFFF